MKSFLSVLFFPVFIFVSTTPTTSPSFSHSFNGTVIEVHEGDLLSVLHKGKLVKVVLADIDCPEPGQSFSQEAQRYSAMMVFSGPVTVNVKEVDRFGRAIAEVVLMDKGLNLNRELIKAGLAWWHREESDDNSYGDLEAIARKTKMGLWKAKNPSPPWEFKLKKGGS